MSLANSSSLTTMAPPPLPPHRVEVPTVNQAAYDPLGINEPLAAPPLAVPEATSSESILTTILNESDPREQAELFNALLPKLAWDCFTTYFHDRALLQPIRVRPVVVVTGGGMERFQSVVWW